MSISSTGLYGSSTIVNSDLFTDVETLKETVTTLNTTYLQTTAEHRTDISQNRADISENRFDISQNKADISENRFDISQNKVDISENRFDISQNKSDISVTPYRTWTHTDTGPTRNTDLLDGHTYIFF